MTAPDPRVGEIENRLNAATPGPWVDRVDDLTDDVDVVHDQEHVSFVATCGDKSQPRTIADAEFIAHSPSDVAYLLAELRKRDEALERVEAACDRVINNEDGHKPPGPPHPTQQQSTALRIRAAVTGDGA